jgi:hypothetical protein
MDSQFPFDDEDDLSDFKYPSDDEHQPVSGIPRDLQHILNAALGPARDWINAGHAFGKYVMDLWPEGDAIEHLYYPLHDLMNYLCEVRDGTTNRILTLAWLQVRFPDVIAHVPQEKRFDFIEGAYRVMFVDGYWLSPHVYKPFEDQPVAGDSATEPLIESQSPIADLPTPQRTLR